MIIQADYDLEALVLLELFLDTEPGEERDLFLAELDDADKMKLLILVAEETGVMP
jgi:hypothetical protein